MELPKFILGDNTDLPNAIYVIHTNSQDLLLT